MYNFWNNKIRAFYRDTVYLTFDEFQFQSNLVFRRMWQFILQLSRQTWKGIFLKYISMWRRVTISEYRDCHICLLCLNIMKCINFLYEMFDGHHVDIVGYAFCVFVRGKIHLYIINKFGKLYIIIVDTLERGVGEVAQVGHFLFIYIYTIFLYFSCFSFWFLNI